MVNLAELKDDELYALSRRIAEEIEEREVREEIARDEFIHQLASRIRTLENRAGAPDGVE